MNATNTATNATPRKVICLGTDLQHVIGFTPTEHIRHHKDMKAVIVGDDEKGKNKHIGVIPVIMQVSDFDLPISKGSEVVTYVTVDYPTEVFERVKKDYHLIPNSHILVEYLEPEGAEENDFDIHNEVVIIIRTLSGFKDNMRGDVANRLTPKMAEIPQHLQGSIQQLLMDKKRKYMTYKEVQEWCYKYSSQIDEGCSGLQQQIEKYFTLGFYDFPGQILERAYRDMPAGGWEYVVTLKEKEWAMIPFQASPGAETEWRMITFNRNDVVICTLKERMELFGE